MEVTASQVGARAKSDDRRQPVTRAGPATKKRRWLSPVAVFSIVVTALLFARQELRVAARKSAAIAIERKRLRRTAFGYMDRRLAATRRVAGFQAYERLLSLWHALHMPLHPDRRGARPRDRSQHLLMAGTT